MNLDNKITLIIPTHDRHKYLERVLDYYSHANFRIIVGDSTNIAFSMQNQFKNIEYYHLPDIPFVEKLNKMLKLVETPYTVFCADDDFIVPAGIQKCIEYLDKNKDYNCATGRIETFIKNKDLSYKWFSDGLIHFSADCDSAENRFLTYFSNYITPTFYAVTKTKVLRKIWEWTLQLELRNEPRFGELFPAFLTIINGKYRFIDVPYQFREFSYTSGGQSSPNISDYFVDGSFDKKYDEFKRELIKELQFQANLDKSEASNLVERGMEAYIKKRYGYSIATLKFRLFVKRLLDFTGFLPIAKKIKGNGKYKRRKHQQFPIEYNTPVHPQYHEWLEVDKIVKKYNI